MNTLRVAPVLLLLLVATSCAKTEQNGFGSIVGRVDGPGPFSVAIVPLHETSQSDGIRPVAIVATDASGGFSLRELEPARYAIAATSVNGACAYIRGVEVKQGETTELALTASVANTRFVGTVRALDGPAQRGATIVALQKTPDGVHVYATVSAEDGTFAMSIPKGWYAAGAMTEGFIRELRVMDLNRDARVELVIERSPLLDAEAPAEVRKWAEIAGVAFDPKAVAEAVGDANVVAIGESTHGTHEFFEARGRLLEALIARGFNVLALEASYTNVLPLDGFVRRGEGTVDDVLMQIGQWTLNVAETREIVLALRAHNMNLPPSRQVAVVGLDFEPGGGDRNGTSERQKALTRFHERAMSSGDLHYVVREEAMADTLRWIRATSRVEPRVVLFAHNSHISRTGEGQMKTPLGSLVAELPGVRYFAVGMSFGEGEFRSTGPSGQRTFRVPAAPGGTIEHLFSSARGDAVVFRFDHDTPAWLTRRHPARHIGGMYGRESAEVYFEPPIAPAREYDAFLFFRTASASRPLGPTGSAGSLEGQPKAAAPANLDFDQPALQGWVSNPWSEKVGYRVHVSDNCASGSCASVIREVKSEGFAFGNVFQRFDAAPYRGQRVRFSAAVRIDPRAKDTRAQLWMRIDGKRSVLFLDNSDDNPIRSTAWVHEVGVTTLVPREADAIAVGMIVYGDGPAYLDSVRIEAVP